jgi:hypothetical protein
LIFVFSLISDIKAQSDIGEIQTFIDSNITRKFLSTNLSNDILSSNFTSKLNYAGHQGSIDYYLKNYYSSSITKLNQNLFRDFDNVKTGLGYSFTDNFKAYANYYGMLFSDDKSIQFKGTSSNAFTISGLYENSIDGVTVNSNLYTGYKYEKQIGEINKGVSISGEFNVENLNLSGYFVDGDLRLGYDDLKPRQNNLLISDISVEKLLSNGLARNEFDGTFSRIRKDFYFPADPVTIAQYNVNNNVEKRTETIAKAFDRFDYTISPGVNFYVTVNPYYRDITKINSYVPAVTTASPSIYDTEIRELSVNGDAALKFDFGDLDAQVRLSYNERDEKHTVINPGRINKNFLKSTGDLEASKNNHTGSFKLGSNIYYSLSTTNRIELSGTASILRYDTPSDLNFDDRDELNYIVYLSHTYNNRKDFSITSSIDLDLYHTVYIFSEKSSNNNWNRILRFTSTSDFTPSEQFRSMNTFSVLANYTVYDFEDIISTVKSYSFRQVNLKDSTLYNFTKNFGIDIYSELKLYERGELNWREFSIRPVDYFEDKIINSEINYFFNKFMILSAGYRYFEQKRYNYTNGQRIFDSFVKTQGPQTKFRVYMKDNSVIEMIYSYDTYSYSGNLPSTSNGNLYVNVLWNF